MIPAANGSLCTRELGQAWGVNIGSASLEQTAGDTVALQAGGSVRWTLTVRRG